MLTVIDAPQEGFELAETGGWQPVPPEHCTEEYLQRECRRLTDELGVRLGVGPMPPGCNPYFGSGTGHAER